MNKLTLLKIMDTETAEEWSFLDCKINIINNVEYTYTDSKVGYTLENGYFYSDNEHMEETIINFTAEVKYENDYEFKRFINRQRARFALEFRINDKKYTVFCKAGNQVAKINWNEWKQYDFELKTTTRPFRTTSYFSPDIPPEHFPGSEYNAGKYNEAKYSTDGASNLTVSARFDGFDADTNSYFTISGTTKGEPIIIYVNGTTIYIDNNSSGFPFFYSNISDEITITINGEERFDLLNTANKTNFLFDLRQKANVVQATGLDNSEIIVYNGIDIL